MIHPWQEVEHGRSYSLDLRQRLIDRVAGGQSRRGAAEALAVSASFAVKLAARHDQTGSLEPGPQGRPAGTGKLDPYRDFLIGHVKGKPDITMPGLAAELEAKHGVTTDPASLSRYLCKAGFSFKKTLVATKRERSDVARLRELWINKRLPIMRAMTHRLVFIDETSTNTKLTRLRRRGLIGERLPGAVPFGPWQSQTFIAALPCNGLTAPWLIEGAMDRVAFDLYVETQLAPTLRRVRS